MHLAVKTHMLVIKYFRRGGVKKKRNDDKEYVLVQC